MADPEDREDRSSPGTGVPRQMLAGPGWARTLWGLAGGAAGVALVTGVGRALGLMHGGIRPGYAVVIVVAAAVGGLWAGLFTVAIAFVTLQVLFVEPALRLATTQIFVLVAFLVVAVLVSWEEAARAAANAARRRLAFLARANETLASSLDLGETLHRVTHLAVPELGDWCSLYVRGGGTDEFHLEVAHADPATEEEVRDLLRRYPPKEDSPLMQAVRTGRPQLFRRIPAELLEQAAEDEEHLQRLRLLGIRSAVVVPLLARGRVMGALSLAMSRPGRLYGPHDLTFTEDLARGAATAIDNARLHDERSRVARTLQDTLLPPTLPEIPGVEVAARYRPAGPGNLVGGDFYDLFVVASGDWAVAVGDVCGKGPEAAALTGLVRHTIRAASTGEPSPPRVLSTVNQQILREDTDRFCTVAYGRLQRGDGAVKLTVSCGGHPPPLILRAGRTVEASDCLGTLLGVVPEPSLVEAETTLARGDVVVFYTDGVTEAYERAALPGDARLVSLLWDSADLDAAGVADRIYKDVVEFRPDPPRDDMAIMVLRLTP